LVEKSDVTGSKYYVLVKIGRDRFEISRFGRDWVKYRTWLVSAKHQTKSTTQIDSNRYEPAACKRVPVGTQNRFLLLLLGVLPRSAAASETMNMKASAAAEAAAADNYRPALWTAVSFGQVDAAMMMMRHADIDERGGMDATTPLMEAVCQERTVLVEPLIGHGANVALVALNGETAMHHVARVGLGALLLLREQGASVLVKSKDGSTPLHFAAQAGHEEVVSKLVELGAVLSSQNDYGYAPLHMAALGGHATVALLLIEHQADVSTKTNRGVTALHTAVIGGNEAVVQLLVDNGADLQSTVEDGKTAHDMATRQGKGGIAAMLKTAAERAQGVHRAKCEAFAMGHQELLGAASRVRWLDAGVVRMVLEFL
jgi:ankyrin repeat protein